jgi:myosin-crossreactive antigen
MKKLLFILTALFYIGTFAQAITVDERINDIFFANGIMTTEKQAWESSDLIYEATKKDIYDNKELAMSKEVDFKLAYNHSYGFAMDMLEVFSQKKAEHKYFWQVFGFLFDYLGKFYTKPMKEITKEELEREMREYLLTHAHEIIETITYDLAESLAEDVYMSGIVETIKALDAKTIKDALADSIDAALAVLDGAMRPHKTNRSHSRKYRLRTSSYYHCPLSRKFFYKQNT